MQIKALALDKLGNIAITKQYFMQIKAIALYKVCNNTIKKQ